MRIAYNEATAMNCSNLETDLVLCEKYGFENIEIRIDMLKDYLITNSLNDLVKFFETSRLRPHAFNAIYIHPEFLTETDNKEKGQSLMDDFMLCCEVGKVIGSEYIIVVPFLRDGMPSKYYQGTWNNTFENTVRILKELGIIAKDYNMKLCFEVVGLNKSSVKSIEEAKEIVETVNLDNVGYVFDIYNLYLYTKSNDYSNMKKVDPEKIFAVHVNNADDASHEEMGQDKRRFCDKGILDVESFLKVLKEIGYSSIVSIETFRPEYWEKDAEWVISKAYKTTKEIIERI